MKSTALLLSLVFIPAVMGLAVAGCNNKDRDKATLPPLSGGGGGGGGSSWVKIGVDVEVRHSATAQLLDNIEVRITDNSSGAQFLGNPATVTKFTDNLGVATFLNDDFDFFEANSVGETVVAGLGIQGSETVEITIDVFYNGSIATSVDKTLSTFNPTPTYLLFVP